MRPPRANAARQARTEFRLAVADLARASRPGATQRDQRIAALAARDARTLAARARRP